MSVILNSISTSFTILLLSMLITINGFWLTLPSFGYTYGSGIRWPYGGIFSTDYSRKFGSDLFGGFSPNTNLYGRRYDGSCHRVENPQQIITDIMNNYYYQRTNGYWSYCSRPNPIISWTPYGYGSYGFGTGYGSTYGTGHGSTYGSGYGYGYPYGYGQGNYGSQYNPSYSSSNVGSDPRIERIDLTSKESLQPHLLGRGKAEYVNGRRDAQLTCNFQNPNLRVIDRPVWVRIIGNYDATRMPYECSRLSECQTVWLNGTSIQDNLHYTMYSFQDMAILKINDVQQSDNGIYRCSAPAINDIGQKIPVYQIVELTSIG